jgi:hypothetical protein
LELKSRACPKSREAAPEAGAAQIEAPKLREKTIHFFDGQSRQVIESKGRSLGTNPNQATLLPGLTSASLHGRSGILA